jgi:glutamate decarboxylase
MPANRQDLVVQRIIVRLGVSRDLAGLLVANFKSAIEHLTRHPASVTAAGSPSAFHH